MMKIWFEVFYLMNKLLLTDEELNYLELLLHNHEYEESERHLIDSLEIKFYNMGYKNNA